MGAHEVNLAVTPSALSVQGVFHPPRDSDAALLHGGQVIQLFHKVRCVCVCERGGVCVCVCVCVSERARKRLFV